MTKSAWDTLELRHRAVVAERNQLRAAIKQHQEDMRGLSREPAARWTAHINESNRRLWSALQNGPE